MLSASQDSVPMVIYRSLQQIQLYLHLKFPNHAKLSHYRQTAIKICIHLHPEFTLCKLMIKFSFDLPIQKIVMHYFDLYSKYNILVTKIFY